MEFLKYVSISILIIISLSFPKLFSQYNSADTVENKTYPYELMINDIKITRNNVFSEGGKDWFFLSPILNSLHFVTRPSVIKGELLFNKNAMTTIDDIDETERNLRATGLFTSVDIELDSLGYNQYNASIITHDRWSAFPLPQLNVGGNANKIGAEFTEFNLFGTGTLFKVEGAYRTENNIGWGGGLQLYNYRFPGTEFRDSLYLYVNKIKTQQVALIEIPYRRLNSRFALGALANNTFGNDYYYYSSKEYELINQKQTDLELWYSHAWWSIDRFFITPYLGFNWATRPSPKFEQAFDNSGYFLLNFSSLSQKFDIVNKLNAFSDEDLIYGGWGSASIGKIFSLNSKGENLNYIMGSAEASFYNQKSYIFLSAAGGSAFTNRAIAKYTYQEASINYFVHFAKNLLFTGRFLQQTVWDWNKFRQLIMDTESGIRGVDLNQFSGDNRIVSNYELRFFPEWKFYILQFSTVGFFDLGASWSQGEKIKNLEFQKSAGLGLRVHLTKSQNPSHIVRIDFPYYMNERKFGVIISTSQMFGSFTNIMFKLPKILGRVVDFD